MTQCELILDHLKKRGTITQLEALRFFGIARLTSRVFDINQNQERFEYPVGVVLIKVKGSYSKKKATIAKYFLQGASKCSQCGMYSVYDTECGHVCQGCDTHHPVPNVDSVSKLSC